MIRATVPSICHAMVRTIKSEKRIKLLTGADVSSAVSRIEDDLIEGFCFAHGYTRLYASDYYCVDCANENLLPL